MGGVGHRELHVQGHDVGIHPVALMIEGGLAVGEGGQLHILGAVEQHLGIAVLEDQGDILAVRMEAVLVNLAFQHLVDDGGIVAIQAHGQVHVEVVQAGDPGHAGSGAGDHGDHGVQAQLFLHGIQLLEGGLIGVHIGQGRGVDAGLVQDVLVVGHAVALDGHGEAHDLVAVHVGGGGVLGPLGAGHVGDLVLVQLIAGGAFDDEDVGFLAGGELGLQGGVVVAGAAGGDDLHIVAGFLGELSRILLQRGVDLNLVLDDGDVGQGGHGAQRHDQSQYEYENLLHNTSSCYCSS